MPKVKSNPAWIDFKLARQRADDRRSENCTMFSILVDGDEKMGSYARILSYNVLPEHIVVAIGQLFYTLEQARPDVLEVKLARQAFFDLMKLNVIEPPAKEEIN